MPALVLGHREVLAALPAEACAQAMSAVLTEHVTLTRSDLIKFGG